MAVLEKAIDFGAKFPGMREWRYSFPVVLALFCSGSAGLVALAVGFVDCVQVSVSALMTCVGMVSFSGAILFPRNRRRFYALSSRLKSAAQAATKLDIRAMGDTPGQLFRKTSENLFSRFEGS